MIAYVHSPGYSQVRAANQEVVSVLIISPVYVDNTDWPWRDCCSRLVFNSWNYSSSNLVLAKKILAVGCSLVSPSWPSHFLHHFTRRSDPDFGGKQFVGETDMLSRLRCVASNRFLSKIFTSHLACLRL